MQRRLTTAKRERIVRDFKRGLSTVGLARKYGFPRVRIEQVIREAM